MGKLYSGITGGFISLFFIAWQVNSPNLALPHLVERIITYIFLPVLFFYLFGNHTLVYIVAFAYGFVIFFSASLIFSIFRKKT